MPFFRKALVSLGRVVKVLAFYWVILAIFVLHCTKVRICMFFITSKYLVPKGFSGLTVFPFVFFRTRSLRADKTFVNHEKIHLRQQLEMLIVPFFVWYFLEFFYRLMQTGNRHLAYRAISFEREAYENEKDPGYLNTRPFWGFLKYL